MSCSWIRAWIGECGRPSLGEFCKEHHNRKCSSCGEQATKECEETLGFVCGSLLCGDCEHTIRKNGCNSGAPLPEGYKDHCKKDEQVYQPWYMTEL